MEVLVSDWGLKFRSKLIPVQLGEFEKTLKYMCSEISMHFRALLGKIMAR